MSIPSTKELKRLAKACRQAGISHFKSEGVEFTLAPEAYTPPKAKKPAAQAQEGNSSEDPNGLSEESLLFWSVGDIDGANAQ